MSKIKFGNRITDLSKFSNFTVNIIPELSVKIFKDKKEKKRDIDILIEIIENKSKEILYSICLENKITDSSINKRDSQLEDELKEIEEGWVNATDRKDTRKDVHSTTDGLLSFSTFLFSKYQRLVK